MQTATVTVQFVNPPKGKGPASIKDEAGRYLKFWTRTIPVSTFQKGGAYKVNYHTEQYNGEDQYYIDSVDQAGAPQQVAAPSSYQPRSAEKDEDIATLAIAKEQLRNIPAGDVATGLHILKASAMMWRQFKDWQKSKNIESGTPRRSMKDEMHDELPEFPGDR